MHGVKSSEVTRKTAKFAAEKLKEFVPMEAGLKLECQATIEEMEEGKETDSFFKAVGRDRTSYDSAIDALFVIDNQYEVYLWQGWWPEDRQSEDSPKQLDRLNSSLIWRGSVQWRQFSLLQRENPKKPPEAYLIHAGLELQMFINLFPTWDMREDVAQINKKAGRRSDRAIHVRDVLQQLKRTRYTLAELQEKPEGIDPLKLETYLSDEEFKKVLTVTREEFQKLQSWKKTELKKNAGLF
ncbi:Supervillin [Apostichopus japonicus]|uniref:Supervillin n=1 Tax=Stichopus japonicus TaxID=307972 RepID=A0A2G8LGY9_STIJA|nr:Supervillin [Apostichopus japonicus]